MIIYTLLILLTLLSSCKIDTIPQQRDTYLITVADDFYGFNGSGKKLENVITDQAGIVGQITSNREVYLMCYTSQNGKRYTSSSPIFLPEDKTGNILETPDEPDFHRFVYTPRNGEEESNWTMDDVMNYIGSLNTDEDDLIIFTFSGHGETGNGALMTNANSTSRSWDSISPEDLLDRFDSIEGKKLLILDSCYSGEYISPSPLTSADSFATNEEEDRWIKLDYLGAISESFRTKKIEDKHNDIWILSSTGKGQEASDSLNSEDGTFQEYYGAFTYYLLKGLGYDTDRNMPSSIDKRITLYSLYNYIRSQFPSYETQIQTPRVSRKGRDLVIF